MICQKISTLHVYWFSRKFSPARLFSPVRLLFSKNFPTCTFISPYTSIRHTRVYGTYLLAGQFFKTGWKAYHRAVCVHRRRPLSASLSSFSFFFPLLFFSIWKAGPKKDQEPLLLRRLTLLCFGLTCSVARDWIFIFRKFLKCNINKGGLIAISFVI